MFVPYIVYTRVISFAVRILSNTKRKIIFDVVLVTILLISALAVYFIIEAAREKGKTLCVSVDGEEVMELSLLSEGEYPLLDGKNILVIEAGVAYMKYADCPRQFCVNTGKISKTGEKIVCLHNRVLVIVRGDGIYEDILESG